MTIHKLAIVTAMKQEAEALVPSPEKVSYNGKFTILTGKFENNIEFKCIISGLGVDRAAEAAAILCKDSPDLLLSIGVSGGIAPDLSAGTLVAATTIHSDIAEIKHWHESDNDTTARNALSLNCGQIQCGPLVTVKEAVLTPKEKQLLHDRTGALAVDMESIAVAQTAITENIPFTCIRAISDDSKRAIPIEAMKGVDENGKSQLKPILKAILKRPALIFELIPMGMDYSKALKSLGNIFK